MSKNGVDKSTINDFVGGTVYQAFLDPWCYHKWHSPVSGRIVASYIVGGAYFLQNPSLIDLTGDEPNYINSQPFLSSTAVRQIYLIEADNKKIGRIFLIMIGMVEISGCHSWVKPG